VHRSRVVATKPPNVLSLLSQISLVCNLHAYLNFYFESIFLFIPKSNSIFHSPVLFHLEFRCFFATQ